MLPTDQQLQRSLEEALVAQVTGQVRDFALRRVETIRSEAMSAEAAGHVDDAIEGYVRFMIAGGLHVQPQAADPIDALLRRTRGIEGVRVVLPSDRP